MEGGIMMSLLSPDTRVNDNISTFFGFNNVEDCEIKVKANKAKDITIVITDSKGKFETFIFTDEDRDSLNRFEIMMTNIFNIYATFAKNYGVKQNTSSKTVDCSMDDGNVKLTVAAIPSRGVALSIRNDSTEHVAEFLFSREDQDIFIRFKTEFNRLVNNISHIRLPNNNKETTNV